MPRALHDHALISANVRRAYTSFPGHAFLGYIAERKAPILASGGMRITPEYSFDDAPAPNVVVIPAQSNDSPRVLSWIRRMSNNTDVMMSVCTGAFLLAKAGVLDGKNATTHHAAYSTLSRAYPQISVQQRKRFVQADPVVFTSGGLSSGIDLALHVVELYFGHDIAEETTKHMEYEGSDWSGDGRATADFSPKGLHAEMDNLTNKTFGNPSTEFTQNGPLVEFSFGGDPTYKGAVSEDGNTISGTLLMDDGKTADLIWTRVQVSSGSNALEQRQPGIIGDWKASVAGPGGRQQKLLLHILE